MSDYEEQVIAGLIADPRRLATLRDINAEHFEDRGCRVLFKAANHYHTHMASKGKMRYAPQAALERTVKHMTRKRPDDEPRVAKARKNTCRQAMETLDQLQGFAILDETGYQYAVDQITDEWLNRATQEGLLELVDDLEMEGPQKAYEQLHALAAKLAPATNQITIERLDRDAGKVLSDYEKAKNSTISLRIPTFCPTLNKVTSGGGKLGRFWLVTAYAKHGKTQLAKDLIYHAALAGRNCAIVTSEQTTSDVRLMLTARHSHAFVQGGLKYNAIEEGKLTPRHEGMLRRTIRDLETAPGMGRINYFKVPHGTSVGEVRAMLESLHQAQKLDVVMIDHTGLFTPTKDRGSQAANAAAVMMEIKDLALNFGNDGLWVIACHQISRDGFEKAEKRGGYYLPSDMANTVEAERSCDLMLYAYRDDELSDLSEIRIGVPLDRYGPGEAKGWHCLEAFESSAIIPIQGA